MLIDTLAFQFMANWADKEGDGSVASQQRDEINAELEAIYKAAPRTDSKAYAAAQDALKNQEELYFSDRELDHLLPKELRRISPGSGDS